MKKLATTRIERATVMIASLTTALAISGCGGTTNTSTAALEDCDSGETGPGVTDDVIKVGAAMPLTGSGATSGLGVEAGQVAYWEKVNSEGGIQDREVEFLPLDDEFDPAVSQERTRQLVERDEVLLISGGMGTSNFLATVPYINRSGVPAVAPNAPSPTIGTMETPTIFATTVDYEKQFTALSEAAFKGDIPEKVALVGVAGDIGESAERGIKATIGDAGAELLYIPETPGTADFAPIAAQLRQFDADWMFLIMTNGDTGNLLKTLARVGYQPKTAAWAGMTEESFLEEFGKDAEGMLVALDTAALYGEGDKTAAFKSEFEDITGEVPTKFNALGWAQAELVAEALRTADGLNRPCVMEALESIENFETGILPPVTWGAEDRSGVDSIGLGRIDDQEVVVIEPAITFP